MSGIALKIQLRLIERQSISIMRKQTKMWTMKNGNKIRICDMSDSHLVNTINLLRRHKLSTLGNAESFLNSLQGDMAIMTMENNIDYLIQADIDELTDHGEALLMEADRRGIDI